MNTLILYGIGEFILLLCVFGFGYAVGRIDGEIKKPERTTSQANNQNYYDSNRSNQ